MWPFGKKKADEELCLVFDIGSSSVGGALFTMQDSGVPKIIYSTRERVNLEAELDAKRLLELVIRAQKIVAGRICMKGLGVPKRIFCVLSSAWYASQTRTIKLEKNAPFIFTSKLADSLIQKEIALFEDEYGVKDEKTPNKIRPIELKNMRTMLNGYVTANPFGQKCKDLEMAVYISMSQEEILKKMEEAIWGHFAGQNIKFVSFGMSAFTVGRDMFVNQDNFLLVNIGGEVTDISMVKQYVLAESVSFPVGRNFLIRGIANDLKCTLHEAKCHISLCNDGHMEKQMNEKVQTVINKLKTEWLKVFQNSLSHLSKDVSIPATVFITVDRDYAQFFSETIKTEQFNQYTLTESKFRVIFLGVEALHGIALFEENTERDPFLIIESIYINRFLR